MKYPTYGSPLLDCVQRLVLDRPTSLTIKELAEEIDRSSAWLSLFACGKMPGASANVVEKLYVRLSGKPLVDNVSQYTE